MLCAQQISLYNTAEVSKFSVYHLISQNQDDTNTQFHQIYEVIISYHSFSELITLLQAFTNKRQSFLLLKIVNKNIQVHIYAHCKLGYKLSS